MIPYKSIICGFFISLFMLFMPVRAIFSQTSAKTSGLVNLRCEFVNDPLGIDTPAPRLSWEWAGHNKGQYQSYYRIIISENPSNLAAGKPDTWKTGKIKSSAMQAVYNGKVALKGHTRYYWQVIGWDNKGKSYISEIAVFETAKLSEKEWKAQWVGSGKDQVWKPAPLFRKEFITGKKIKKARIYVSGLGYYELSINGTNINDNVLDPGFTHYDKRVLYSTYDVTSHITTGANALGIELGNGFYNDQSTTQWEFDKAPWRGAPRFILELHMEFEDGSKQVVLSDKSWKTADSPLRFNNIYSGEVYDARMEVPGWNKAGFQAQEWVDAVNVTAPSSVLQSQIMPPIRPVRVVKPVSVKRLAANRYVFDMGENFAGVCRLKLDSAKSGMIVAMKHGEMLKEDGTVDQSNIDMHFRSENQGETVQTDIYVAKGGEPEVYAPRFTYHGFQYVEVETGESFEMNENNLEGIVMHTDVNQAGQFSCSNELLNKIWQATNRSYLSNLYSIPTDCPQREKNGWTADGHAVMDLALLNFDGFSVYEKWMRDWSDALNEEGRLPGIIPTSGVNYDDWIGPIWDAGLFVIPKALYQYYNDNNMMKTLYPVAETYLKWLGTRKQDNGLINFGISDWLTYRAQTPSELTGSCFYYMNLLTMSDMAKMTGRETASKNYAADAEKLRKAILDKFYNPSTGEVANRTQTAYAIVLYAGILPREEEPKVAEKLYNVVVANDYSLDFGFLGSKVVLPMLTKYGYADAAYNMASKETMPSWGYWIKNFGATTLYETWDVSRSRRDASLNHVFLGDVSAWMYRSLAGIDYLPEYPGFSRILIKPSFVSGLNWVEASYQSVRGLISSRWERAGDKVKLILKVPSNTQAELHLPYGSKLEENGSAVTDKDGSYLLGPGEYYFVVY